MKRCLIFMFLIALATSATAKGSPKNKVPDNELERRIDFLICKKEYNDMLVRIEHDSLVSLGTTVDKGVATYRIGKPKTNIRKGTTVIYSVRYSVKEDKILSVAGK